MMKEYIATKIVIQLYMCNTLSPCLHIQGLYTMCVDTGSTLMVEVVGRTPPISAAQCTSSQPNMLIIIIQLEISYRRDCHH